MRYLLIGIVLLVTPVAAEDWPQFRGSGQDGISAETGLLDTWPAEGPPVLWRRPLGGGFSAPSVVDGRIFVTFGAGGKALAGSFDAATGKEIWRTELGPAFKDRFGEGPRATPSVVDGQVYTLTSRGRLHALSAEDGSTIWQHDLDAEYKAKIPQWGMAASPLVEGKLVLVQVGADDALLAAFDRKTGAKVWQAAGGGAGYAAPLAIDAGGERQVVFFTANSVYAVAPDSGKLFWKLPWKTSWDVNAAMPVFVEPDRLFVSSGYDTGSAMLQLAAGDGEGTVAEAWRNRDMKNQFSSSVLHDSHLYGFDNKILKCISVETGEMVWRARDLGHGSLIYADGKLIVMGEQGQLVLVDASPEAYQELGRAQVFDGRTWTMPVVSDGKLVLRDEQELVAIDLAGS